MGPLTEGDMLRAEKKRRNVSPKASPPAPIPKSVNVKKHVSTIKITIGSVIQTRGEVIEFGKIMLEEILEHILDDDNITRSVTPGENEGDYNLEISLPEIV